MLDELSGNVDKHPSGQLKFPLKVAEIQTLVIADGVKFLQHDGAQFDVLHRLDIGT
jgi:hypothetical protein